MLPDRPGGLVDHTDTHRETDRPVDLVDHTDTHTVHTEKLKIHCLTHRYHNTDHTIQRQRDRPGGLVDHTHTHTDRHTDLEV